MNGPLRRLGFRLCGSPGVRVRTFSSLPFAAAPDLITEEPLFSGGEPGSSDPLRELRPVVMPGSPSAPPPSGMAAAVGAPQSRLEGVASESAVTSPGAAAAAAPAATPAPAEESPGHQASVPGLPQPAIHHAAAMPSAGDDPGPSSAGPTPGAPQASGWTMPGGADPYPPLPAPLLANGPAPGGRSPRRLDSSPLTGPAQRRTDPVPDEVHVHIGRIEVTAIQEAPPTPSPRRTPQPPMSLQEYLERRKETR